MSETTRAVRLSRLAHEDLVTVSGTGAAGGTWHAIGEIFRHREMLDLLIRRDLKSRYKDSVLGFAWTLVRPIVQLVIYFVIIGKVLGAAQSVHDYAVYVFSGLILYSFFSEMITGTTGSIVGNSGLIKKIYLPREVFPLASIGSAIFNFLMQFVILIAATLISRAFPISAGLIYLIPSLLLILVYGTAFGLLLAAVNVYLRDIQYLVEVAMLLLLWASPIVYSYTMVHQLVTKSFGADSWVMQLYTDNPITLAVLGFRKAMWTAGAHLGGSEYPDHLLLRTGIAIVIGLILIVVFQRVFARLQGNFAQEI
ncbi:ABC transporter permease [Gryllotalpicola reticulitermitis]|uniref:Transport permease protein n=1 Tax=Gryllotalpicola reticulitermitis TaxID=1184153 RepID=A0ABV8Q7W3_9MICO